VQQLAAVGTPASLPAAALLVGVALGALGPDAIGPAPQPLLIASWAIAAATCVVRQSRAFAVASAIGFLAAGALMGQRAVVRALEPSLLSYLEGEPWWHESGSHREPVSIEGRLRTDAVPTPVATSLSVWVERVQSDGRWTPAEGGALLSIGGEEAGRRAREWVAGRRVRMTATLRLPTTYWNPGVADERRGLALRGTIVVGSVKSARLVEVINEGSSMEETAARARGMIRAAVESTVGHWSARSAAIVTAILIGDRARLDEDVERRLQEAGTYHVMAISGGNIAILAGAAFLVLGVLGLRDRRVAVIPIAILMSYAILVGGGVSVVRATLMAVSYLFARLFDHRSPPFNAVAVAVLVTVALAPLSVFDAGFALTFGATVGILVGARVLTDRLQPRRALRPAAAMLGASLAAEAVVLPIGLFTFGRLTVAGPFMNFVAIPMMALAQMAGLVAVMLAILPAGGIVGAALDRLSLVAGLGAHVGATVLVDSTAAMELAPWLSHRVPPPAVWVVALYFTGLLAWVAARAGTTRRGTGERRLSRIARCGALVTVGASIWMIAAPAGAHALRTGLLSVVFLDVGQGDAALVRLPHGASLLVDAGGAPGAPGFDFGSRVVVPAVWARGVSRLDALIVTHGDPDHVGGAPGVVRDLRPRELWEGIDVPRHAPTAALRVLVSSSGGSIRSLARGWRTTVDGVEIIAWHPPRPDWERQRVRNDDSLVIELRWRSVSLIFSGDVGSEVERELSAQLAPAALRVLKVPHHGSRTSSSRVFLEAARPAVAVVSAGRGNRFGHPAADVVRAYAGANVRLFRTDRDGAVTVSTDGTAVVVETYRGESVRFTAPVPPVLPASSTLPAQRAIDPAGGGRPPRAIAQSTGSGQ
jgi:competence protein ComEC